MESDEKIQAHIVSIWRESKKFFAFGGKEGMLVLTDKHLMFVHKTDAKMKWWKAITCPYNTSRYLLNDESYHNLKTDGEKEKYQDNN